MANLRIENGELVGFPPDSVARLGQVFCFGAMLVGPFLASDPALSALLGVAGFLTGWAFRYRPTTVWSLTVQIVIWAALYFAGKLSGPINAMCPMAAGGYWVFAAMRTRLNAGAADDPE